MRVSGSGRRDAARRGDAVARHADVEQADVGLVLGGQKHGRVGGRGLRTDGESRGFECLGDHGAELRVVVGDQHGHRHGISTSIVAPCPGAVVIVNTPPIASARSRMLVRPKPVLSTVASKPSPLSATVSTTSSPGAEAHPHRRGVGVPTDVVDRLTHDSEQCFDRVARQIELGREVEHQIEVEAVRGVARRQCELFARVPCTGERRDDEPRLVERVLGRVGQAARLAPERRIRVAARWKRCRRAPAQRRRAGRARASGAPPSRCCVSSSR